MADIITNAGFRTYAAQKFLEGLIPRNPPISDNNLYLFIGATLPWTPNDNAPPFPNDTVQGIIDVWSDIMHLKRVNGGDTTLVIPRNDWKVNIPYSQYSHDVDLFDPSLGMRPFFVVTDEWNVYKCLYNNNGGPSYIKPTGTTTNILATRDKYLWKYMFTVSQANVSKFVTDAWIPVQTLTSNTEAKQWAVQSTAIDGSLDVIQVVGDGGQNYSANASITVTGDGSGCVARPIVTNGSVTGVTILARGTGYRNATAVVNDATGSGAVLKCIISPPGGHGFDAVAELGGFFAMIDIKTLYDETSTFTTDNDFRRIGLILNPTKWGSQTDVATASPATMAYALNFGTVTGGGFVPDETVSGIASGATAVVLDYGVNASTQLRVVQVKGRFLAGETIVNSDGSHSGVLQQSTGTAQGGTVNTILLAATDNAGVNAYENFTIRISGGTGAGQQRIIGSNDANRNATVTQPWNITPDNTSVYSIANISYPDLQPLSGHVLYIGNRRPIIRDLQQFEDTKIVIEF